MDRIGRDDSLISAGRTRHSALEVVIDGSVGVVMSDPVFVQVPLGQDECGHVSARRKIELREEVPWRLAAKTVRKQASLFQAKTFWKSPRRKGSNKSHCCCIMRTGTERKRGGTMLEPTAVTFQRKPLLCTRLSCRTDQFRMGRPAWRAS